MRNRSNGTDPIAQLKRYPGALDQALEVVSQSPRPDQWCDGPCSVEPAPNRRTMNTCVESANTCSGLRIDREFSGELVPDDGYLCVGV